MAPRPETAEPDGLPGVNLWLVLILAAGFLVRVWGLDFGLPYLEARPDESTIIRHTMAFFSGDPNPHFFNYPSLYLYLLFAAYLSYFLIGRGFGFFSSPDDLIARFIHDPYNIFLIDRALSVFFGTATILVVFYLARRLWGRRTALVAALFMALAYLHARDSHFGTTDAAMVFLALTAMLFIVRARQEGSEKNYLLAGLLTGLAASTKYNAVLLVLPLATAHFFNTLERARQGGPVALNWSRVFVATRRYLLLLAGPALLLAGLFWAPNWPF
jgi:4-amino-4-deoxy-L-arabinose transferase-like glycosyltransferase